jgi:hypothetical protein
MPTKEELQTEVERLTAENVELRDQVAAGTQARPNTRPKPQPPSFGLSAGTVADLQQVKQTNDPFTGKPVTRADAQAAGYDVPDPEGDTA